MPADKIVFWCFMIALISWPQAWTVMKEMKGMTHTRAFLQHKYAKLESVDELLARKIVAYHQTLIPAEDEDEEDDE